MKFSTMLLTSAAVLLAASVSANAATVVVNFDDVPTFDSVNGFYSGGTSSSGASGANLGVSFTGLTTVSGFGQTSQPNLAYNDAGPASVNTSFGFSAFSFTAGAFSPGTVSVFSGANGTGTLLGSLSGALGNPGAFSPFSVSFSGIGHSVTISGGQAQLGFDDLTFTTGTGAVPEPATWAMMIVGFGLVGASMRRRQMVRVTYA